RLAGEASASRAVRGDGAARVALLFTGQGAQTPGMGRGLRAAFPAFRDAFDEGVALFDREVGVSLTDIMWADAATSRLHETAFTQPALFAFEYALAALWRARGLAPDVLVGHSVGELVAACIAGVFSLCDAVRLVAARGRLMQELPAGGAMV